MRIAVVGSREFTDMTAVRTYVETLPLDVTVVSGGARGVDTAAVEAAKERGMKTEIVWADWDKYGRSAGPIRNKLMIESVDEVTAFWDGASKGTSNAIQNAEKLGKKVTVIRSR